MGFPVFAGACRVLSSAKNSHKVEAEATSVSFVSVIRKYKSETKEAFSYYD
jgi:hypothetical protein